MKMEEKTTIRILKSTRDRLLRTGRKGDSYDRVVDYLLFLRDNIEGAYPEQFKELRQQYYYDEVN